MSFPIIPKLNSAPGAGAPATLTLGELAANRSTAKLYLGTDTGVQELAFAGSLGGTAISTFTAAGGTSFSPINGYTSTNVNAYLVSVGGIEQRPTVDWTISSAAGGTVVFATAPPLGVSIVVRAVVAGSGGGSGGTDIGGRAWSGTATYTEGDLVATDQTSTWICIQADNTNHEPSASPTWWARMPASAVQLQFRPLAETAPTDGQAIVWDEVNATWKPSTVSGGGVNATQLQGRDIASTAPTAGQFLRWNATTSKWEPTSGGGTITFSVGGTHYFSVPANARWAKLQATAGNGTGGTNGATGGTGQPGTSEANGDPGTDGADGNDGTVGSSIFVNGILIAAGGAPGAKGFGGKGGGGGNANPGGYAPNGGDGGTGGAGGDGGAGGAGGIGYRYPDGPQMGSPGTGLGGAGGAGGDAGFGGIGGNGGGATSGVNGQSVDIAYNLTPFAGGNLAVTIEFQAGSPSITITW